MWGDSWPNIIMKMKDMPYYKHTGKKDAGSEEEKEHVKDGDIEILQKKFAKYKI
jgi:hypothetical protein